MTSQPQTTGADAPDETPYDVLTEDGERIGPFYGRTSAKAARARLARRDVRANIVAHREQGDQGAAHDVSPQT